MSALSATQTLLQIGALRAVDHALAQCLLRLRADTPAPVLLAVALCSRALAQGHSHLPLARVDDLLAEIAPQADPPKLPTPDDWTAALRASPWVTDLSPVAAGMTAIGGGHDFDKPSFAVMPAPTASADGTVLVLENDAVSLRRYWQYEVRLALALRARLSVPATALDAGARERIAAAFPAAHDTLPARAAEIALSSRLLLLTGGPGTGKTRTIALILDLLEQRARENGQRLRVALTAPTGKAAARLAEAVRERAALPAASAQTLHRLLGLGGDGRPPRYDAMQPLPFDVVVVDEASMVDLPMMARLLDAVPAGALLLLVGDPDQLPSVETGAVLAALCDAADVGALSPHHVRLSHVHRQTSALALAPLIAAIRAGAADDVINRLPHCAGLHWQHGHDAALTAFVREQALPHYRRLQACEDLPSALREAGRFRVLTALRDGPAGSRTLNALIARLLQPDGAPFFPGRLLLITENSYRHGLFNGDVGLCWPDADGQLRVWFDHDDRGGAATSRAWHPAQLPAHESAFALTVHKAQGSEFAEVLLALPEHDARVITRELLYTGLSRGRERVTLWADEPLLRTAIGRPMARWQGLAARLR